MNLTLDSIAHWNKPTRFGQRLVTARLLRALPEPGATAAEPAADHIIHAHYFGGPLDAWLVELDEPEHGNAFGFVKIAGQNAEWGSFSLPELLALRVPPFGLPIERDIHWKPTPARQIPKIAEHLIPHS